MSTGTLVFILLIVGMLAMHLFGHSRHGGAAGSGHGIGGCCGGHGHGAHDAQSSARRPQAEHEPDQGTEAGFESARDADEPAARPRTSV